jgi:hypothetical protein
MVAQENSRGKAEHGSALHFLRRLIPVEKGNLIDLELVLTSTSRKMSQDI